MTANGPDHCQGCGQWLGRSRSHRCPRPLDLPTTNRTVPNGATAPDDSLRDEVTDRVSRARELAAARAEAIAKAQEIQAFEDKYGQNTGWASSITITKESGQTAIWNPVRDETNTVSFYDNGNLAYISEDKIIAEHEGGEAYGDWPWGAYGPWKEFKHKRTALVHFAPYEKDPNLLLAPYHQDASESIGFERQPDGSLRKVRVTLLPEEIALYREDPSVTGPDTYYGKDNAWAIDPDYLSWDESDVHEVVTVVGEDLKEEIDWYTEWKDAQVVHDAYGKPVIMLTVEWTSEEEDRDDDYY